MDEMNIRAFSIQDLSGVQALQPPGWDDVGAMFRFYDAVPFCFPMVAVRDGRVAATGSAIVFSGSGWLAHIIVAPEQRRLGLGRRMTEVLMELLEDKGCETQSLIATAMGEPLYAALGFRVCCRYLFFEGPKLAGRPDDPGLVELRREDLPDVFALDRRLTGEDREPLLGAFVRTGWLYRHTRTKELLGYYLPDLREGTILAREQGAGLALLALKHHLTKGRTVVPEPNRAAQTFLRSCGFSQINAAGRMVLGRDLPWDPETVFSRIAGYCP